MAHILIDIGRQTLTISTAQLTRIYRVSTALNGVGQAEGSEQTPIGIHVISEKIGDQLPLNAVLRGREPTGEIYDATLGTEYPVRDWILTRILWLTGLTEGVNAGWNDQGIHVDSHARYIYIHGTPDSEPMGEPRSHGCIRMRNTDIVDLFDLVEVGSTVTIVEST
jgi:lipoprotein-anchoring transpeptidase ErfK/SrfK